MDCLKRQGKVFMETLQEENTKARKYASLSLRKATTKAVHIVRFMFHDCTFLSTVPPNNLWPCRVGNG